MKKILIALVFTSFGFAATAADLVAVVTDESAGTSNGAIDLTISGGVSPYSITWTGPSAFSSTSEDITGLEAGDYSVEVTDAFCGIATYTFTVEIANSATIVEVEPFTLSIYPNPTTNLVQIQSSDIVDVAIYSLDGKLITQETNVTTLDFTNKADGTYIVKFISAKGVIERKIIKE